MRLQNVALRYSSKERNCRARLGSCMAWRNIAVQRVAAKGGHVDRKARKIIAKIGGKFYKNR